jgi:hypothetical protein
MFPTFYCCQSNRIFEKCMYCFNLMFLFVDEPASDSALPQGYRGVGYNPNFENADEYPPSQTPVQANPRKIIDLSKPTA